MSLRKHLPAACAALALAAACPAAASAEPPANDDFAAAQDLGSGATASARGSTVWATAEAGEPDHDGGGTPASVWYRWTAPDRGAVRIDACSAAMAPTVAVYRGAALDALARVARGFESHYTEEPDCGVVTELRFFAIAGTTYRIAVNANIPAPFGLDLRRLTPPANDAFARAHDLGSAWRASATGTNLGATVEPGEAPPGGGTETTWYGWTAPGDRNVQVDTCGSDFDTVLSAFEGAALDDLALLGTNDDDGACGLGSAVRFDAAAGATYRFAVATLGRQPGRLNVALQVQPTNVFGWESTVLDRARGTATLVAAVPNPGLLQVLRSPRVRGAGRTAPAAGELEIPLRPRGATRRRLARRGKVTVNVRLRFTPTDGVPFTLRQQVKLRQRR